MRYASKYITLPVSLLILAACLSLSGCKTEEKVYPAPAIQFAEGSNLLTGDTLLMLNDTVHIRLMAATGSNQKLTHLHLTIVSDSLITNVDSALYTDQLTLDKTIVKGVAKKETWSFYVRDRESRKSSEISIVLDLNPASVYGNISNLPSVILGAQNNTATGSFLSLPAGRVYPLQEASQNQALINMLYYFDLVDVDKNTIASPGANIDPSFFPGNYGIPGWTIKNTTRFVYQPNLTAADFDRCRNDSLILSNSFEFITGKRKAKDLEKGQIWSFVTDGGLKGLFKVKDVQREADGLIEIALKMKN